MENVFNNTGLVSRRIERGEREGRPTYTTISESIYHTDLLDLWDALTNKERLPRWFAPVEGELRLHGRYQIQGNASGTITHCEEQKGFDLTWEFAGDTSWVKVELFIVEPDKTKLRLQHQAGAGGEHFQVYGPGAAGVGWDLATSTLSYFIETEQTISENTLLLTPEAKEYIMISAEAWGQASADAGFDRDWSVSVAKKTAAFFAGE